MVRQTFMKTFSFIIIIFLLTSCKRLTEKHFKSSDLTTGGFTDIRLDLNADKTLSLIKIDQKVISQNDAGSIYIPDTTVFVFGNWTSSNDKIYCKIIETPNFIMDAFLKSTFKTKGISLDNNQISFLLSTDTIFIYGQPCIATKTTTR